MPTFPYVKRSYQHPEHPRKKRKSHYRLGLNRAIASSTVLHEEASALRSQYYLSRIDLVHYPMGRVVLRRSSQKNSPQQFGPKASREASSGATQDFFT